MVYTCSAGHHFPMLHQSYTKFFAHPGNKARINHIMKYIIAESKTRSFRYPLYSVFIKLDMSKNGFNTLENTQFINECVPKNH